MAADELRTPEDRRNAPHLSVELTNSCNLHCGYCVRDEDALYHTRAEFFSPELLRRILRGARETYGIKYVSFTGGEVTIHPRFAEIIEAVADEGVQYNFVTNGWHFERIFPALLKRRENLSAVAFSLDGATQETHDHWRGEGSFVRVVRGVARCYMSGIPVNIKVGIRRDTVPQLQEIALLAARLGARSLHFSHLLPTSSAYEAEIGLSREERALAEQEIAILANIFKMEIGIAVGYYNLDPAAPCTSLRGTSCNVDYRGQLTLCCNMAGYRGAQGDVDVVADLRTEEFAPAYERLQRVAAAQLERRRLVLESQRAAGVDVDLYTGSPCLFCLQSFGKIPWHEQQTGTRSLPVISTSQTLPHNVSL